MKNLREKLNFISGRLEEREDRGDYAGTEKQIRSSYLKKWGDFEDCSDDNGDRCNNGLCLQESKRTLVVGSLILVLVNFAMEKFATKRNQSEAANRQNG